MERRQRDAHERILLAPMSSLDTLLGRVRALLFDFDGVLVDSERFHYESYRIVFERHGHALDRDEYWRHWTDLGEGATGEIRRHSLNGLDPIEVVEEKKPIYEGWVREGRIPFRPGALELLDRVAGSGLSAAIASNTAAETIRANFTAFAIGEPAIPIVGGTPGLRKKPHPDLFLEAARVLAIEPRECLVIEDARKGVEAASRAGMSCVVFRNPENRSFLYPEAVAEIESLEELASAIEATGRRSRRPC